MLSHARSRKPNDTIREKPASFRRTTTPARFSRTLPPDWHTTIIDRPPPRRASWLLMAAMFTGGALGLVSGFVRMDDAPRERTGALQMGEPLTPGGMQAPPAGLEIGEALALAGAAPAATAKAPEPAPEPEPQPVHVADRVQPGESLSVALARHGVGGDDIGNLVAALKKAGLSPRTIRAEDEYRLGKDDPGAPLALFEYRPRRHHGVPVRWRAARDGDGFKVEKVEAEIETRVDVLGGEVTSNLYLAMKGIGEGSALVSRFADVFAWDIDFYRQTRKGDTFKVAVEKRYAEGNFVGYGRVLAAEYVNAGEVHRGFTFTSSDGKLAGVFDENGRAREKTFIKSPLEIARITSSYGQRFHPILKRKKNHNGVDYGASKGTPFWAVADGVVKEARYSRTAGNMIVIRHIRGYETQYFHATGFAKGIKVGARVKQRQVIGYVGNTGRSTAPHLHFGMKKHGRYVNPGKQKFPAANPVPKKYKAEFDRVVRPLLAEMEALEVS